MTRNCPLRITMKNVSHVQYVALAEYLIESSRKNTIGYRKLSILEVERVGGCPPGYKNVTVGICEGDNRIDPNIGRVIGGLNKFITDNLLDRKE